MKFTKYRDEYKTCKSTILHFPRSYQTTLPSCQHPSRGFAPHPWHSSRCRLSSCYLLPAYYPCSASFTPLNSRWHLNRHPACIREHVCVRVHARIAIDSGLASACTRVKSNVSRTRAIPFTRDREWERECECVGAYRCVKGTQEWSFNRWEGRDRH